ncbi:hypothetical protein BDK51DRAFT_35326, partial [Blyttiomyces helicus]
MSHQSTPPNLLLPHLSLQQHHHQQQQPQQLLQLQLQQPQLLEHQQQQHLLMQQSNVLQPQHQAAALEASASTAAAQHALLARYHSLLAHLASQSAAASALAVNPFAAAAAAASTASSLAPSPIQSFPNYDPASLAIPSTSGSFYSSLQRQDWRPAPTSPFNYAQSSATSQQHQLLAQSQFGNLGQTLFSFPAVSSLAGGLASNSPTRRDPSQASAPTRTSSFTFPPGQPTPDGTAAEASCRWATCTAHFSSLDELLPHISKLHLSANRSRSFSTKRAASPAPEPAIPDELPSPEPAAPAPADQSFASSSASNFIHACKWALCTLTSFFSVDELIQHVCSDHLAGLTNRAAVAAKLHGCAWLECEMRYETFDELTDHVSEDHIGSGYSEYICRWEKCERNGKPFTQRQKVMRHIQT